MEGVAGFGDGLPSALRSLADELEREVGQETIMAEYTEDLSSFGDLMTLKEFKRVVRQGCFVDDDGFGHPVKDGKMAKVCVHPSQVASIPKDATHIMWFNK